MAAPPVTIQLSPWLFVWPVLLLLVGGAGYWAFVLRGGDDAVSAKDEVTKVAANQPTTTAPVASAPVGPGSEVAPAELHFETAAPPPEIEDDPDPQADEEQRDEQRAVDNERDQREEKLRSARRRVDIAMYATEWCPSCKQARAYMREAGISFEEHDVEENVEARKRHRELNPRKSVPTFDIDGAALVGFRASSLERAIDRAASARAERTD